MRICESNSAECTGINPCPYCYAFIYAKVLPDVVRAGGLPETQATAEARFAAYDAAWKKALGERIAEKNAALPNNVEPYKNSTLIEFFMFKDLKRERLQLKAKLETQAGLETKTEVKSATESLATEALNNLPAPKGIVDKPSAKLGRGDLKRMAEKKAKQSLAPGNGIHGDTVSGGTSSVSNGSKPAVDGTHKNPGASRDGTRRH